MDWSSSKTWITRAGASALAFVLGASASAGTLYSWKTDDGTFAYTDDKKRVPARYKAAAEKSKLESMQSYARYTPGPDIGEQAYAERVVERLEVLRGLSHAAVVSSGGEAEPVRPTPYVKLELGGNGDSTGQIEIPLGAGLDDAEPIVVEHVRMRPGAGQNASRHFRVVKQGDRVLAVIKDRSLDQKLSPESSETSFD